MSDEMSELRDRLVVRRKRDGRSVYDEAAKAELIALCLQPSVSVARVARECGVNANQVSRWLREHGQARSASANDAADRVISTPTPTAFVELSMPAAASTGLVKREPVTMTTVEMQARLPNGVVLDLRGLGAAQICEVVQALGRLACSASTTD